MMKNVKSLIKHGWTIGVPAAAVVAILSKSAIEVPVELVNELYAKWEAKAQFPLPKTQEESCIHTWHERGDERTAYFSITCTQCGANGLI